MRSLFVSMLELQSSASEGFSAYCRDLTVAFPWKDWKVQAFQNLCKLLSAQCTVLKIVQDSTKFSGARWTYFRRQELILKDSMFPCVGLSTLPEILRGELFSSNATVEWSLLIKRPNVQLQWKVKFWTAWHRSLHPTSPDDPHIAFKPCESGHCVREKRKACGRR